jgi:serine/threonine protein kinase
MHPTLGDAAMADDYHMLEELGSGSFGVVYKAVEKASGDLVAIKHVRLPLPLTLIDLCLYGTHPPPQWLTTNSTDRPRRQRRRHSRDSARDRSLEHMLERARNKIQGQFRAWHKTMDRHGIPRRRLVFGSGMSTSRVYEA